MNRDEHLYLADLGRYLRALLTKGVEQAAHLRPVWQGSAASENAEVTETLELLQSFLDQVLATYAFQKQIANGDLSEIVEKSNMLAMPLKGLQASLRHLAWQAEQIANGDYNQTVHFLGGFSTAFNAMIEKLKERELLQAEKATLTTQLFQTQKMEAIGRLAAGMAHEINTPAHFITLNLEFIGQGFADIASCIEHIRPHLKDTATTSVNGTTPLHQLAKALEGIDWDYLADEIPKALSQSQGGIARVASIVNSLKELAQPARQGLEQVDLNRLIIETATVSVDEWNRVAAITTKLDPNLPLVAGTESQLRQVLFNLIVNGAQAVEEKMRLQGAGEKGLVSIQSRLNKNRVEFAVYDTGAGIRQEDLPRVFEPFFTTKEVGQGTGQGLTVVHDIVANKHGGAIAVDSTPGKGTTITVSLPMRLDPTTGC